MIDSITFNGDNRWNPNAIDKAVPMKTPQPFKNIGPDSEKVSPS